MKKREKKGKKDAHSISINMIGVAFNCAKQEDSQQQYWCRSYVHFSLWERILKGSMLLLLQITDKRPLSQLLTSYIYKTETFINHLHHSIKLKFKNLIPTVRE